MKPHILFNKNGLAIWYGFPVITHIEVESGHFEFDLIVIFHGISLPETAHFVRY